MSIEDEPSDNQTELPVENVVVVDETSSVVSMPKEIQSTPIEEEQEQIVDTTKSTADIEDPIRVFLQNFSLDTITTVLEKRAALLGEAEFKARMDTVGTYENLLVQAANDYSLESERALWSIDQITDLSLFDNKLIRDGKTILSSSLKPRRASGNGKTLSGREARIEFAIKTGQAKRVPLYNSGFYIDIEAPTLSALNSFFTKTHEDTNKYGREFGALFFYFNGLMIKEAVIELVMPLIMSTTLKNWNRGDILLRNLKLTDLRVILNAIAALMFPDGFNFTHYCANPAGTCTHQEEQLIDINKLFRHDFMKLSNDNINHMHQHDEVTQEQVNKYQEALGFTKTLRYNNIEFELHVPSIDNYLIYGRKFNTDLLKSNFADNNTDVYRSLLFSFYQVYTPFVQSVTLYDEDNKKDITSSDPDVIAHQLSRLQSNDAERKFEEDMKQFIASTEITQISYPAAPCPKCNHIPEGKGYHAVDPEHTFFTLVLKRLTLS